MIQQRQHKITRAVRMAYNTGIANMEYAYKMQEEIQRLYAGGQIGKWFCDEQMAQYAAIWARNKSAISARCFDAIRNEAQHRRSV